MVVSEVAALAETKTVAGAVFVLTVSGRLAATACMIAVKTQILCVVDLVCVFTIRYLLLARFFRHELRQFR